jgi:hypothetical protein
MNSAAQLLYLNGAFDVSLCTSPPKHLAALVDEMSAWFLLCARPQDRVLLRCALPPDYLPYLEQLGMALPPPLTDHARCDELLAMPWGWNQEALDTLSTHGARLHHPNLDTVRMVNGRIFSYELSQRFDCVLPGELLCHSAQQVQQALESFSQGPLVVKPCFGNAGIGFVKIAHPADGARHHGRIQALFAQGQPAVTVAPWLQRRADLSTRFVLDPAGDLLQRSCYRTLVSSAGAFYGMLPAESPTLPLPWQQQLERLSVDVGAALHEAGYFGPVNIDSMVVTGSAGEGVLVPLVEINARWSMHLIAKNLHQQLAPQHCGLFRTLGRNRHTLPNDYAQWHALVAECGFDPRSGCGVVLASPLRVECGRGWVQPARSLFYISAHSPEELRAIDERFSARLNTPELSPPTPLPAAEYGNAIT